MPIRETIYEAMLHAARPPLRLAAPFHAKLARGLAGRRRAVTALERWAAAERAPDRPLVWVHAPSVGEGLMAQAILAELRERRPDVQTAFTFFSPSAEGWAPRIGADVHGYLPWDVRSAIRPAVAALRPAVVVFVRTEIWPVLTREARRAGARLALVNAVLAAGSSRLGRASRFLLRPAYARLDAVGAVAEDDAARFSRLGVARERVRVTGDARFDQVWRRVHAPAPVRAGPSSGGGGTDPYRLLDLLRDPAVTTVVAGSTWPPDESRLLPACAQVCRQRALRLIIAPHEPTEAHVLAVERSADAAGLAHARLAAVESGEAALPNVVIVDRVGVLADLYAVADVAYVGGGFHAAGLHSVVEPAALGVPVLFGPRHGNAREAAELEAAGAGFGIRDAASLAVQISTLAAEPSEREGAGRAAAAYVRSRLGAAARNAELILELLD